jgi:hypothetical protein
MKSVVAAPSCTSDFVNFSGQLQNPLGGGGFTGINVSEDTDVSVKR